MAENPTPPSRPTARRAERPAPDAPVTVPPATKKRSLNDGPTGRARAAEAEKG